MATVVKCPHCRKPVPWDNDHPYKPFCSERCRLIDLGEWVMEEKRIPGESLPEQSGQDDDDSDPAYWQ
ncbi:MAG: DNA gyrase inhibitor YacG [Methylobacter sp.]|nr:MAG: DNA gyrase inhibitor YacG [Methylobacter sp.]PPD23726.1 MAG: DNA gyrase inhibitor YacG [Methylobacter sp.]PPD32499.1 MAG: DNA gyrase inhibitor YacG [Methylomonas sp.]